MSTATLVPLESYLATLYRPDQEWIEGRLVERNLGQYDHSSLQGALFAWFYIRQREWNIRVLPEQRLHVAERRFRIPDACVLARSQEIEQIFSRPPLICIEVLSPDDTLREMRERLDDYVAFGVPHIWVFDPVKQLAYEWNEGEYREAKAGVLSVPGTLIEVPLTELFAELD